MKKLMNYSEFLSEYVYKKFGPLDRDIVMRDLGIDDETFKSAMENFSRISKKNEKAVIKLIKKLESMTSNEVLLRELLGKIIFIYSYGKVIEAGECFRGIYQNKDNWYSTEIYFGDEKISSYARNNFGYSNIIYEMNDSGYSITYDRKNQKRFGDRPLYEDVTKKIVKNYDISGRQVTEYKKKIKEDYFKDKETGDKILTDPCVFYNFTNKKFMWRDDEFIFMREEEKHVQDDTDDVFIKSHDKVSYYIGKDDNPDKDEMRRSSEFFGIDPEVFEIYESGMICALEVWSRTRPKYRNHIIGI